VDLRIGVIHTVKEIEIELAGDADRDKVREEIEAALSGESRTLWLTDRNGRDHAVPADKIAWVELGRAEAERRIGFVH
jgi:hypothetical protein